MITFGWKSKLMAALEDSYSLGSTSVCNKEHSFNQNIELTSLDSSFERFYHENILTV